MSLAKSDGTTLEQHISDCLTVFDLIKESLPLLPEIAQLKNFWMLLFSAVYLHDFGKVHKEFQKLLNKQDNHWANQRHEVYSIPFVDKLNLKAKDIVLIKKSILAHHKFFDELKERLKDKDTLNFEYHNLWKTKLKYHPEDFIQNLKINIPPKEITKLFFDFEKIVIKANFRDISSIKKIKVSEAEHPLKHIINNEIFSTDKAEYWQHLLLWGALKLCDHYGSANINRIYNLQKEQFDFLEKFRKKLKKQKQDFYSHQKQCSVKRGHCILIAPTGSGKTESALLWLKNQLKNKQGRTFYVLPYTASINAMHKRLSKSIAKEKKKYSLSYIGMQHGKLLQYINSYFEDYSYDYQRIKKINEYFNKMIVPLKIVTPFQILKYMYGVKNFEIGFVQLAGAKLIFDEIHAYDVTTFAQIIVMLKFLNERLKCQFMIMTATLPSFLIKEIQEILGVNDIVKADKQLLNINRHKIVLKKGNIFDRLPDIITALALNKKIIIVCNTVNNAQNVYARLKKSVDTKSMILIHGRFNGIDRVIKEQLLFDDNVKILIGTQAIEVSIDIDYDLMFTEPAPFDALIQRMGRINRKGAKKPCSIIISREGGTFDGKIYDIDIINRTISILENVNLINENEVQILLDKIYPNWTKLQKKEYDDTKNLFEQALESLQPYYKNKENEEAFYEKFTNIQVLPVCFYNKYKKMLESFNYIKAEELLVSIHKSVYAFLKNKDIPQIYIERVTIIKKNEKIINHSVILARCKYDSEIGMTYDYEEEQTDNFI